MLYWAKALCEKQREYNRKLDVYPEHYYYTRLKKWKERNSLSCPLSEKIIIVEQYSHIWKEELTLEKH